MPVLPLKTVETTAPARRAQTGVAVGETACPCGVPNTSCPAELLKKLLTKNLVAVLRERDQITFDGSATVGPLPDVIKRLGKAIQSLDNPGDCGKNLDTACGLFAEALRCYFRRT